MAMPAYATRGLKTQDVPDPNLGGFDPRGMFPKPAATPGSRMLASLYGSKPKRADMPSDEEEDLYTGEPDGDADDAKGLADFPAPKFAIPDAAPAADASKIGQNRMLDFVGPKPAPSAPPGGRDLASAMAFAQWKANNPDKDPNEFWSAREGQRGAGGMPAYAERALSGGGMHGAEAVRALQQEALRGNPQAVAKVEYLAQHPEFAQAMFGRLPYEIEEEQRGQQQRRASVQDQRILRESQMKAEQQRIQSELAARKLDLEAKHQEGALTLAQKDSENRRLEAEARNRLAEAQLKYNQTRDDRALGLQEKELGFKYGNQDEQKLNAVLDRRAKEAQVKTLEAQAAREATGERSPKEAQANLKSANNRAQELVDKGLSPEEAANRAGREFDVDPSQVIPPQYSENPGARNQRLQQQGFGNEDDAFKAALEDVVAGDPGAHTLLGDQWTAEKAGIGAPPLRNPQYKRQNADKIVRALVGKGVPAQDASRIVRERVNRAK